MLGKESDTSPLALADYLEKNMEFKVAWGTVSSVCSFSPPVLQKLFLFPVTAKEQAEQRGSWRPDRLTDWQRRNCAQPSLRSALQTHAFAKSCKWTGVLLSVLWCVTAHLTASPEKHQLHIQRLCLNPVIFLPCVFLALSRLLHKTLHKALSFPDLLILKAKFEIWSLLKAPRLMLLCSSASCLKK